MSSGLTDYLFPTLLIIAGTGDVLSRRISNRLIFLCAFFFVTAVVVSGVPTVEIVLNVAIGAAVLLIGTLLFSMRLLGGGDVKLLASVSLWMGLQGLLHFLYFTVLAGGMLALGTLLWVLADRLIEWRTSHPVPRVRLANPSVPCGYAITLGALLALPGN